VIELRPPDRLLIDPALVDRLELVLNEEEARRFDVEPLNGLVVTFEFCDALLVMRLHVASSSLELFTAQA